MTSDGSPIDHLAEVSLTQLTLYNSHGHYMNQNFTDARGNSFTTPGLDFWTDDPHRGFDADSSGNKTITLPIAPTFEGLSAPYGSYDGSSLPLPHSTAEWDTHFLGDFNMAKANPAWKAPVFDALTGSSTSDTLRVTDLSFHWPSDYGPAWIAQLVFDRPNTWDIYYSITVHPGDPPQTGLLFSPEPSSSVMGGLMAMTLMICRRSRSLTFLDSLVRTS